MTVRARWIATAGLGVAWLLTFSSDAMHVRASERPLALSSGPCCQPGCVVHERLWNRRLPWLRRALPDCPPPVCPPAAPAVAHETKQLGTSVLGVPIVAHFFGTSGGKTLIFGAIHGDEPTSAFATRKLIEHLTEHPDAYAGRHVAVLPVANPDGLARRTRTNAREIDLNRNFPAKNFAVRERGRTFGGEQPGSEPETQVLIRLIEDWQPQRIITIHSIARGRHGNNFDGPGESLAQLLSRHNGYAVLPTIGYPTPGSFGSWAGNDSQIPTITLEFPRDATGDDCWRENRDALLNAIQAP